MSEGIDQDGPDWNAMEIALRLGGSRAGQRFVLPPDPTAFHRASPGSYRLRDTGDVVEDPDFTATWTISPRS